MIGAMRRHAIAAWLPWLGVLLILAVPLQSLWGAPPYGDDIRLHVYRIPIVNALWQAGAPYARWIPFLNYGYGSPLFTFYPPVSAYALTAVYWLAGQDAPLALNLLLALTIIGAAAGMYLLGRHLHGVPGGLLATAYFVWSPHFIRHVFARTSIANALAISLFPLATLAFLRAARLPSARRIAFAAVTLALILLSHTAASFLFLGPLAVIAVVAAWTAPDHSGGRRPAKLRGVIIALTLGLSLASFSWLPALTEIRHTRYAREAANVDFRKNFADWWAWPGQTVAGMHNQDLPKTPGRAQIVVGAVGTASALVSIRNRRRRRSRRDISQDAIIGTAGLLAFAALFLAMSWSSPVWQRSGLLRVLQFPWRWLDVPTFLFALTAGRLLVWNKAEVNRDQSDSSRKAETSSTSWQRVLVGVLLLAALLVPFANLLPYVVPPRLSTLPRQPTLADVTSVQQQYLIYGLTGWGEYSVPSIKSWPSAPPFEGADTNVPLHAKLLDPAPGITPVQGDAWSAVWHAELSEDEKMTLAVHDFPGWRASIDGDLVSYSVSDNGLIQLDVPAGEHRVALRFGRTTVRWLADGVTLIAALVAVLLFVIRNPRSVAAVGRGARKGHAREAASPALGFEGMMVMFTALLLVAKVGWVDRVDNWFVRYPIDGRVAGANLPEFGNFNGEVELIGYQITEPDQLTLLWHALEPPTHRYTVAVDMVDASGIPRHTIMKSTPGQGVTTNWETGQLTRDRYRLPVDVDDPPVGYYLFVSMLDEAQVPYPLLDAPWTTSVPVGRLKRPPPAEPAIAASARSIGARFDGAIALTHADVPTTVQPSRPFEFTLYWESAAPVREDYTVFVHLLDAEGKMAAGQDGQPVDGIYPTSFWEPGELITDRRILWPELSAGTYQLQIGLYRLASGRRLPVSGPDAEYPDRVALGTVDIVPGDS